MDLTTFVAQLLAVTYLSVGVGFLADKKYYQKLFEAFFKDATFVYLGGVMALIVGFTLVTFHNEWVKSWEVLITIIGWMALIKGVALLAFPAAFLGWTKAWFKPKNMGNWGFIVVALGLVFGYFGFIA